MKTKIKFGFKSKNQMPLFMVWREYYENNEVTFAAVLFELWGWVKKPSVLLKQVKSIER